MADFTTIEGILNSFTPSDMLGTVTPSLGQDPNTQNQDVFKQLLQVLENSGRGVYSTADIIAQIGALGTKSSAEVLSDYLSFYSTQGPIPNLGTSSDQDSYVDSQGATAKLGNALQQIIGADFPLPTGGSVSLDVALICSRTPFFSPQTRNCHRAEPFLNNMPNTVLAQLVPFLQAEFMISRPARVTNQLQTAGLLKFLIGAVDTSNAANPKTANDAMIGAHLLGATNPSGNQPGSPEVDFAGMEMFTSPQTLYNPSPNTVGKATGGARYADVLDPTRPFATLEHATINIVPAGAGFYTYKKATLQIKIHDRSRLSEISDLIRPRVYTGVTVWLTYGWRAPVRSDPKDNPYFEYINNNMLMREAYGIVNSNFSFDNVGQVTLTLELFTKGVNEMRQSKIADNNNDQTFLLKSARQVGEQIAELFVATGLDPSGNGGVGAGLNHDSRAYMVLDAMEQGQRPNLSKNALDAAIIQLATILSKTPGVDQGKATQLITTMQQYAKNYASVDPSTKFAYNPTNVDNTVNKMFEEVYTGPDPFLPTLKKQSTIDGSSDLKKALDAWVTAPKNSNQTLRKGVVSFGKLFSVFAGRNLTSAAQLGSHDELQIFFYQMNEQCGPVSSTSIASFPIDMGMFADQYRENVIRTGGQNMTLEDFLGLVINAQFLDPRNLGYGMKGAYQPYDSNNPEARVKDRQGDSPSELDKWQLKYGTFKQPMIEMYIECAHQRPGDNTGTQNDILQLIGYSAKNTAIEANKGPNAAGVKRIMRIHIYDKQLNPYKGAATLLRDSANRDFIQVASPAANKQLSPSDGQQIQKFAQAYAQAAPGSQVTQDPKTNASIIAQPASYQQAKDLVSKMVPTIRFGANGTTIVSAALASKADPRVSSVQMQRTMNIRNDAHPAGGGERGFPVRVIPAMLNMTTIGNPLATMAQMYFIDFQTGTTLDNIYIVTGLSHTIGPGKYETTWQFGYADAYGVWEGAQQIDQWVASLSAKVPGQKG